MRRDLWVSYCAGQYSVRLNEELEVFVGEALQPLIVRALQFATEVYGPAPAGTQVQVQFAASVPRVN